jgi:U32 family peptidase
MKHVELLAPAGNLEKMKTALTFGADAVYCGAPDFSLRVRINQFDLPKIREGIEFAHELGKKVYITVNIFAHNKHLLNLEDYILKLKDLNPDALIVSDPGILSVIKQVWPEAEIHLSTQANCTNWQAAKFWHEQGVKRVILGREVTLEEIKEIHEKVPEVELECFVHGAMCMSYSGRCLLSKFFTDRSANLGDCTQPCRWEYKTFLQEIKRPDELLQIEEDEHGSYIMNSQDLCLVGHLKELVDAGIVSLKIEGRAKSLYYVGNTINIYRQALDNLHKDSQEQLQSYLHDLQKSQNRGFTKGFIFGADQCEQKTDASHEKCDWEFCGQVVEYKNNQLHVKVHNQLFVNDDVELVVPHAETVAMKVEKLYNDTNESITEAHGGQDAIVRIPHDKELPSGTLMRRKV